MLPVRSELSPRASAISEKALGPGALVAPGTVLGALEVLAVRTRVVAGPDCYGIVVADPKRDRRARIAVEMGSVLYELDPSRAAAAPEVRDPASPRGLVFLSPSSGRFYRRPGSDKPPFVEVGGSVSDGQPVGLLEVMKTFHRLSYGAPGLPSPAKIRAISIEDGADIEVGDPILELEAP